MLIMIETTKTCERQLENTFDAVRVERKIGGLSFDHVLLCFCNKSYYPYEQFHRTISDFCRKYGFRAVSVRNQNPDLFEFTISTNDKIVRNLRITAYPTVFLLNMKTKSLVRLVTSETSFIKLERAVYEAGEIEYTYSARRVNSSWSNNEEPVELNKEYYYNDKYMEKII